MSLTLYYHPLASFCWKPLIALYESKTPFTPHLVDLGNEEARGAFHKIWPMGEFPVLRDEKRGQMIPQSASIIEYLALHYSEASMLIPSNPEQALEARRWDQFYDSYVQVPMSKIVTDTLRPPGKNDSFGVEESHATLRTAYDVLEVQMKGKTWALGDAFSLADCSAAPALYYANQVEPFESTHKLLAAYMKRLEQRPSFARVLEEAKPYFHMFPYKSRENLIRLYGVASFDRGGKVRWLLNEMGVKFEDRMLSDASEQESPAFLKLNPMGRVPVLEIGDQVLFESGAICAYLADLHLDKGMAPALNAPERADYQKWMFFASATVDAVQKRMEIIEDIPAGAVHSEKIKDMQDELRGALEALDQALGKGSFLVGNRFGTADICVCYQLYWLRFAPELKSVMDAFPRVAAYIDRMLARPAAETSEWPVFDS